jgi:hypothetical protein
MAMNKCSLAIKEGMHPLKSLRHGSLEPAPSEREDSVGIFTALHQLHNDTTPRQRRRKHVQQHSVQLWAAPARTTYAPGRSYHPAAQQRLDFPPPGLSPDLAARLVRLHQ